MTRPRAAHTPASAGSESLDAAARFAADVHYYLIQQPRQLPSRYLYDELGSALFEAICRLPWYPITAAEVRLLTAHGAAILRQHHPSVIVELGSGSGEKLGTLLRAAGPGLQPGVVHLVDLSAAALAEAGRSVSALVPRVAGHLATYEDGIEAAARGFSPDDRVMALFLGSNIGNFDPPSCEAFLREIRRVLGAGDALLLGADLVKPERALQLAYDDPLGVTAAFNRNLLVRVNRELGADFDISRFTHRAVWNEDRSRVEMHLVSDGDQHISIPGIGMTIEMAEGESIWTESSYKYRRADISRMLSAGGFRTVAQWIDERAQFALTLAETA